jgi:hypothetical protein
MAVSLGFGVVFATFITLVIVPATYVIVEDVKKQLDRLWNFIKRLLGWGEESTEPAETQSNAGGQG